MEKADPTSRVSAKYDDRGRLYFDKRPKTETEFNVEELRAALVEAMAQKKAKVEELRTRLAAAEGIEPLCPTCNKVKNAEPNFCSNAFHVDPPYLRHTNQDAA